MQNFILIAVSITILMACGGSDYSEAENLIITDSTDGVGSFYECFGTDYYETSILPEEAYRRAECFISLVRESSIKEGVAFNELDVGANQHTILQYANSWYALAAEKGYPLAAKRLDRNQLALYAIEGQISTSNGSNHALLASEEQFYFLDLDHSGTLTLQEVMGDHALADSFAATDLDENGQINIAEYFIFTGEATAAGNETSFQELLE